MAVIPNTNSSVQATINAATSKAVNGAVDNNTLAGNFQTFLTLLTTQLKNQNPLDPLDTNQFTQQLVQFAQVEQQIKQNSAARDADLDREVGAGDHRPRLCRLDRRDRRPDRGAEEPAGDMDFQRAEAGDRHGDDQERHRADRLFRQLLHERRQCSRSSGTAATPTACNGRTATTRSAVTGKDTSGQTVAIPSEIEGVVDSVDLTKTPPELTVGGQPFTLDKIKRVVRPRA